ncbi:alpha/beta hydrolase [Naasia lichenicola]|nr:dienelactone hydrolase family protein [Naasia lichenicola]
MAPTANPHLVIPPLQLGPADADTVVIGVHGRGQDPSFIADLRDRLQDRSSRWIVPSAADQEWYGHRFMDRPADDPAVVLALEAIDSLIATLEHDGVPAERITLVGFSQGACLLAHHLLTRPRRYAGVLLFTGGYLGRPSDPVEFAGDLAGTPVLLGTIDADPWVPLPRTQETDAELRRIGAAVTLLVESGSDHGITAAAVELGSTMLLA